MANPLAARHFEIVQAVNAKPVVLSLLPLSQPANRPRFFRQRLGDTSG